MYADRQWGSSDVGGGVCGHGVHANKNRGLHVCNFLTDSAVLFTLIVNLYNSDCNLVEKLKVKTRKKARKTGDGSCC